MHAVILAAGEGKRMRPLTYTRPKAMLPLVGRPLTRASISRTKRSRYYSVHYCNCYCSDKVRDHFGNGTKFDVQIDYVMQSTQSGSGKMLS